MKRYNGEERDDYSDLNLNRHIANTLHINLGQDLKDYIEDYVKPYHIPETLVDSIVERVLVEYLNR